MDDRDIASLYWERNEAAIRETQNKYGRLLQKLALGVLRVREDGEEVVSDACLAAWNAIPPEQPENLCAYLCSITRNLALNRLRRDRAVKRGGNYESCSEELLEFLPVGNTVEEAFDAKETAARISAFLRSQKPKDRGVFLARYWYFMSPEEIAGKYGMNVNTVRSRLYRTRQRLFTYLKEECVEYDT